LIVVGCGGGGGGVGDLRKMKRVVGYRCREKKQMGD